MGVPKKAFRFAAAAVTAALLVAAGLGFFLVRRNLPDRATPRVAGLAGEVRVAFDDRGVARVEAARLGDALRLQGYLSARERMFQMELARRAAAGELAELFGAAALPVDEKHRTYGFSRVAEAAVPLLPANERADLQAFADGVNAFLASHEGRWGVEFTLLGARPRPWTPADSLRVLLLMYEDLTSTWEQDLVAERLARRPEGLRQFLLWSGGPDEVVLVPDAVPPPPLVLPDLGGRPIADEPEETPGSNAAALAARDLDEVPGSNAWVVSGAHTKSGKPLLANDPHLAINVPALWLPIRFAIAGRPVEGVALPGLPGVILGRNDALAWGFTNLMADVADLYRESLSGEVVHRVSGDEPVDVRTETIAVRGKAPKTIAVRTTSIGPLLPGNLALRWTALDPRNLRLPVSAVMLATDTASLMAALDDFTGPPQNVMWASASGSIGWRAAGRLPIRESGDGSLPYDGAAAGTGWKGFIPPAEMPRVVDPPSGFLVTANQRVVGTSYPHVVSTDWASPTRARRIRDLLEEKVRGGEKLDRAAMEAIQLDVLSAPVKAAADAFRPHLPPDLAALLDGFDGRATVGSRGFLLARTLRRTFREKALAAWRLPRYRRQHDDALWTPLLEADAATFARAGLGEKGAFLKGVVEAARAELTRTHGSDLERWTWGRANRLAARHPLGRVPGLSWLFDAPWAAQSGTGSAPKASSPAYGQSMRFVVDWAEPEATTLVVPFGVSGHAGAPHRFDQIPHWLRGDPNGEATRLARPAAAEALVFRP